MANSLIIIRELILLFAIMLAGYISFRRGWVNATGSQQLSAMIVKIFNPALIIATAVGGDTKPSGDQVASNLVLVVILFASLIVLGPVVASILHVDGTNRSLFRIMIVFCNLGFMGIPLVSSLYGESETFFVAWYILGFNFLFYSWGLDVFAKAAGRSEKFSPRKLLNSGMIAGVIAVALFFLPIELPAIVADSVTYVSSLCVPCSMLVTGFALAQIDLRTVFTDGKMYCYIAIKMLAIPIIAALLLRTLGGAMGLNPVVAGIMVIMYGMPSGSLPIIVCEEYGLESEMLSRGYALTTILALITLPLITLML